MFRNIWISGCLLLSISGCAQAPVAVPKVKTVRLCPPAQLLVPQAVPELQGDRTRDLVTWAEESRSALQEANADKQALQDWAKGCGD